VAQGAAATAKVDVASVHAHEAGQDTTVEVSSASAAAPAARAKAYPPTNCNAAQNTAGVWAHIASSATRARCVHATIRRQTAAVADHARTRAADAEDVALLPRAAPTSPTWTPELKSLQPPVLARLPPARTPRLPVPPPGPHLPSPPAPLTRLPLAKLPHPPLPGSLRARASRLPPPPSSEPPKPPSWMAPAPAARTPPPKRLSSRVPNL
jgi:hypothetical protein